MFSCLLVFPGPKKARYVPRNQSGRKKEPKPKLFGPDIFSQRGRGLPRERVGAKKFDTSLETREIKLFGRDILGFCWDILGAPEKFEKKMFGFNREVLNGVGADGVGVKFPIFPVNCSYLPLVLG